MAGVRVLPFICMVVFFGFVNDALVPKFGYYMPRYVFGDVMILIGSSLMGCKYLMIPSAIWIAFLFKKQNYRRRKYLYIPHQWLHRGLHVLGNVQAWQA